MKYLFPDIKNSSLAYRGRRFWIIEITGEDTFGGISKSDADYAFYDARYQALYDQGFYAAISDTESGGFMVAPTTTHIDMSFAADSLSEVVQKLPGVMDEYLKTCYE